MAHTCMADTCLDKTVGFLADLVRFPTVSSDSNLDMIEYLGGHLEDAGARVEIFRDATGAKANVFATVGPDLDGGIVLSGHTDVVPVADQDWTSDPFRMSEREGCLFGRGTCDMKGFIAATLAVAPLLKGNAGKRPIHFAFTHDEETGCIGARHLIRELRRRDLKPAIAIIGEPTEMRVIEGHKGCHEYTTRFKGLEGHGSAPDLGVNAAEYAARYVGRLLELRDQLKTRAPSASRFEPPWTTINVGAVSGGVAHNVIAGKAGVEWEMRPVQPSDTELVKTNLAAYCNQTLLPTMRAVHAGASIETEVIAEIDGLLPMDENAARELVMELTGANGADLVAFGTEAGLFQSLGMSAVVCGPGSIRQAHRADEFVALDQLRKCVDMLTGLAVRSG